VLVNKDSSKACRKAPRSALCSR